MCLNLPFEVKNQPTFYKVRWFKYTFCYSVYYMFEEFLRLCNFFFQIPLKMEKNEEDFKSSIFLEAQKYDFLCEWRLNFFPIVIFAALFRLC